MVELITDLIMLQSHPGFWMFLQGNKRKSGYLPYGKCDPVSRAVHADPRCACTRTHRTKRSEDSNVHPGRAPEASQRSRQQHEAEGPELCHAPRRTPEAAAAPPSAALHSRRGARAMARGTATDTLLGDAAASLLPSRCRSAAPKPLLPPQGFSCRQEGGGKV